MNFRGQDKRQQTPGQLGNNPNMGDEKDDYIVNLQQQIHFMELELKILKEKVLEDEQKSGIGSLYDDDKSSHQHISLLKNKYAQMKRDFDRTLNELNKQSLKVKGQEFVLDSQTKIVKEQTQKLKKTEAEFNEEKRDERQHLTFTTKDYGKQQYALEGEMRELANNCQHAEDTHKSHKIQQEEEKTGDEENKARHDQEVKLMTDLKTRKQKEKTDLEKDLAQIEKDFLAKKEYQDALAETAKLREKIEADKVTTQFLEIQVNLLTNATDELNEKRDTLAEEKKLADTKNEELKTQFKAKEEIENKRLQSKLNREKSAEYKELLANEEMIKASNEDIQNKLRAEKETYDNLLKDKIELTETFDRCEEEFKIDTKIVEEQDALLAELKKLIEAEQAEVDKLEEAVIESNKIKKVEEDRHRREQQENTALTAKMEFIEANYDYTTTPEEMQVHFFTDLKKSNEDVNKTVDAFKSKVEGVKDEVKTILMKRRTF